MIRSFTRTTKYMYFVFILISSSYTFASTFRSDKCHLYLIRDPLDIYEYGNKNIEQLQGKGYVVLERNTNSAKAEIQESDLVFDYGYSHVRRLGPFPNLCTINVGIRKVISKTEQNECYEAMFANVKQSSRAQWSYGSVIHCERAEAKAIADLPRCELR